MYIEFPECRRDCVCEFSSLHSHSIHKMQQNEESHLRRPDSLESSGPAGTNICRFCHCKGTADRPLFNPCKCKGSIKHIHEECLKEWLRHANRKPCCELCGVEFLFTMPSSINVESPHRHRPTLMAVVSFLEAFLLVWLLPFLGLMWLEQEWCLLSEPNTKRCSDIFLRIRAQSAKDIVLAWLQGVFMVPLIVFMCWLNLWVVRKMNAVRISQQLQQVLPAEPLVWMVTNDNAENRRQQQHEGGNGEEQEGLQQQQQPPNPPIFTSNGLYWAIGLLVLWTRWCLPHFLKIGRETALMLPECIQTHRLWSKYVSRLVSTYGTTERVSKSALLSSALRWMSDNNSAPATDLTPAEWHQVAQYLVHKMTVVSDMVVGCIVTNGVLGAVYFAWMARRGCRSWNAGDLQVNIKPAVVVALYWCAMPLMVFGVLFVCTRQYADAVGSVPSTLLEVCMITALWVMLSAFTTSCIMYHTCMVWHILPAVLEQCKLSSSWMRVIDPIVLGTDPQNPQTRHPTHTIFQVWGGSREAMLHRAKMMAEYMTTRPWTDIALQFSRESCVMLVGTLLLVVIPLRLGHWTVLQTQPPQLRLGWSNSLSMMLPLLFPVLEQYCSCKYELMVTLFEVLAARPCVLFLPRRQADITDSSTSSSSSPSASSWWEVPLLLTNMTIISCWAMHIPLYAGRLLCISTGWEGCVDWVSYPVGAVAMMGIADLYQFVVWYDTLPANLTREYLEKKTRLLCEIFSAAVSVVVVLPQLVGLVGAPLLSRRNTLLCCWNTLCLTGLSQIVIVLRVLYYTYKLELPFGLRLKLLVLNGPHLFRFERFYWGLFAPFFVASLDLVAVSFALSRLLGMYVWTSYAARETLGRYTQVGVLVAGLAVRMKRHMELVSQRRHAEERARREMEVAQLQNYSDE